MEKEALEGRAARLRRQIEELEGHWPAHSLSPALLEQLDELEAELERVLAALERARDAETDGGD